MRKRFFIAVAGAVLGSVVAGVAYGTIPDDRKVYTACMLKGLGTIRLIDKSLPSTNLMSRCTDREIEVSWNQAGQAGPPGPQGATGEPGTPGTNGTNGTDGVSVTSAAEPPGTNCPDGGSRFTASNGTTYACNGDDGGAGSAGTAFAATIVLNGDPPVEVYDNPVLGSIEVGCLAVSIGGVPSVLPQVAFWNSTSQTLSVDMLTGPARIVAPGGRVFLVEDGTSWIGPDAATLPGAERGSEANSAAVTRPFARVDVISRVPFPVTPVGVGGVLQGCAYTVAVAASP